MRHFSVFSDGMYLQRRSLGRYAVNMHRSVTALCGDILIHWIPCDALDVMTMLDDLLEAGTVGSREYASNVVRASSQNIFAGRAPGEVIYLHCSAPMEQLDASLLRQINVLT